jgi:hypothetical protein
MTGRARKGKAIMTNKPECTPTPDERRVIAWLRGYPRSLSEDGANWAGAFAASIEQGHHQTQNDDIAKIAAGLTPGEIKVLCIIANGPATRPRFGATPWVRVMQKKLSEWGDYEVSEQFITPLGLRVRAYLLENRDEQR